MFHVADQSGKPFHFACWEISHDFCHLLNFFKIIFLQKFFQNTIIVSNSLDPDQARHFGGPDLGPNCFQL